jgi:hypothetical protein
MHKSSFSNYRFLEQLHRGEIARAVGGLGCGVSFGGIHVSVFLTRNGLNLKHHFVDHLSQLKQMRIRSKLAKQARVTA